VALTLDRVGFAYPVHAGEPIEALRDVSLRVAQGELVLVLGATGSGKSTLLQIAAGLLGASTGVAELDGEPLSRATARGVVGMVFQDPESQLFADNVLDDVAFGPVNLGVARDVALADSRATLERVGLRAAEFESRSPFALSGGEARRAAIAGVLAMAPRYLLLDEPTAGLDARGRAAVADIVRAERERCGVVVVSHSADEFLGEADRVLVLHDGRAVFEGDAAVLTARPDAFDDAGLAAPEVLRAQQLAVMRGANLSGFSLDAEQAARALADALASARSRERD
jgi:energy-coupling factor transport system ATP-binding protein